MNRTNESATLSHRQVAANPASDPLRERDDFIALLAHELRNPLAPIRSAVQILRLIGNLDPTVVRARDMIDRQVTHLARLVDDLLDVSRIARGKIQLKVEAVDLTQIVRQTVEDFRRTIEASGLALKIRVPESAIWTEADPTRLAQIVSNLLHNAMKFTDPGGQVRVAVELNTDGTEVAIRIIDTGIGMDGPTLARAFDSFSQADCSLDRSRGGLGLGLALVRGLVDLHCGTVEAQSDGLGRGTTMTVRLPVIAPNQRVTPAVARTPIAGGNRNILIIDDNRDAAESLKVLLSLSGHHVKVAHTGPMGLEAARAFHPSAVFCDIGLPGGMDGYAVARALRTDPELPASLLVAVTGFGQDEDLRRSQEAGFDAHLVKPVDHQELQTILHTLSPRD